jgi:hypothetical protein
MSSEGFTFTGWSPLEDSVIKGPTDYNAQFEIETDDNVTVDPEDPETEIIAFTKDDLTYESGELLIATVEEDFFKSLVDSLINTLDETVLQFPEIEATTEDGIEVVVPKGALVYAEDNGIDLLINSNGYSVLIPNSSLVQVLDSIVTELRIQIKDTDVAVRSSYDLGDYTGSPFETVEINLLGSTTPITDFIIEVTTDSDHDLVFLSDENYSLLESNVSGDGMVTVIQNNGVLIKSTLTEKETTNPVDPVIPITPEPRFDPVEWLFDLEFYTLVLIGLGSFLVVYGAVYAVEFYRGKN